MKDNELINILMRKKDSKAESRGDLPSGNELI